MEVIDNNELKRFIAETVEVSIQDQIGEEKKAPFIKKRLIKTELCPDKTHLRLYFDDKNFFAIPLHSEITVSETEWIAYDSNSELYFCIRKVDNHE